MVVFYCLLRFFGVFDGWWEVFFSKGVCLFGLMMMWGVFLLLDGRGILVLKSCLYNWENWLVMFFGGGLWWCLGGRIWLFFSKDCLVLWLWVCLVWVSKVGLLCFKGRVRVGWVVLKVILFGWWYRVGFWVVLFFLWLDLLIVFVLMGMFLLLEKVVRFCVRIFWVRGEVERKEFVKDVWWLWWLLGMEDFFFVGIGWFFGFEGILMIFFIEVFCVCWKCLR